MLDQPVIETAAADIGSYVFRDEAVLGTRMQLMFVAATFAIARDAAMAVRAEIDRLDLILSGYRADSELAALNSAREHRASAELFAVVSAAERWLHATNGAFSGRLGFAIDLWRQAIDRAPPRTELAEIAVAAANANLILDRATRTIMRPREIKFALDGIAKGWIVDRAFDTARAMPGIAGALVDIGGDIRCGGAAPDAGGWRIGIADPRLPFDNAPLVATTKVNEGAIATSGRGPRDRILGGARYSPTLSPRTGWPIAHQISASVIATSAFDADALATATLVMTRDEASKLAGAHGAAVRIESADVTLTGSTFAQVGNPPAQFTAVASRDAQSSAAPTQWQDGWQALATFTAPRRQLIRDPQFRSPYMAMWITDVSNKPVRTLILVGKRADWQKDNFIWWAMHRSVTERLVSTRSMSTSGAGVYNVFWDGVDDAGERVPAGKYVLHVETSRERGKHTYRSLTLDFGKFQRFTEVLAPTEEGGGLRVAFDHY